jgi:hypothetical protein
MPGCNVLALKHSLRACRGRCEGVGALHTNPGNQEAYLHTVQGSTISRSLCLNFTIDYNRIYTFSSTTIQIALR